MSRDAITMWLLRVARVGSIFSMICLLAIMVGEWDLPLELSARDALMMGFFPFGVVLGMILAWWNERKGGLITLLSLVLFYVTDYVFTGNFPRGPWFFLFSFPGILFLIHDLSRSSFMEKY